MDGGETVDSFLFLIQTASDFSRDLGQFLLVQLISDFFQILKERPVMSLAYLELLDVFILFRIARFFQPDVIDRTHALVQAAVVYFFFRPPELFPLAVVAFYVIRRKKIHKDFAFLKAFADPRVPFTTPLQSFTIQENAGFSPGVFCFRFSPLWGPLQGIFDRLLDLLDLRFSGCRQSVGMCIRNEDIVGGGGFAHEMPGSFLDNRGNNPNFVLKRDDASFITL